jgi:biopolymer transport protein ExbD
LKIPRKAKIKTYLPIVSMADIAFLLLIFFIIVSLLQVEKGIPLKLPWARKAEQVPRRKLITIFLDHEGKIMAKQKFFSLPQLKEWLRRESEKKTDLMINIQADQRCSYTMVNQILEELRSLKLLQVYLGAKKEKH